VPARNLSPAAVVFFFVVFLPKDASVEFRGANRGRQSRCPYKPR
jgi:hypothetical protein